MERGLHEKLVQAIRSRDVAIIVETFFEGKKPQLRTGFFHESDLWDFKSGAPGHGRTNEAAWAQIAADVLAFHNKEGGILFFGIDETAYSYCGTSTNLDSKKFNDKLRRYTGDAFWVTYSKEYLGKGGLHLGIVIVPKRNFRILRAHNNACVLNLGDKPYFEAGDLCVREGDETKVHRKDRAEQYLNEHNLPSADYRFAVDRPGFKILRPDYRQFVFRKGLCPLILEALEDPKSFITSLLGFGGLGKTALATWAALEVYEAKKFDFIVSLSAKDRELKTGGIQRVEAQLSSFDSLLDEILRVMGFSEECPKPTDEKAQVAREILKGERILLYVDNLETVDDARIFAFLENLPIGVRVLATSRKTKLRRGLYPIDVGPMTDKEATEFFEYCCQRKEQSFLEKITSAEQRLILEACSHAPLLIEWFLANSKTPDEAIHLAHDLKTSGHVGDELLEFCFRRVDKELDPRTRKVLRVISLHVSPMPIEAIAAGAEVSLTDADDACQDLIDAALVQQDFSGQLNDSIYFMLPVTQRFAYQALRQDVGVEQSIRKALSSWYEARDVKNPEEQKLVSDIRKGTREPETVLVEYAESMLATGHFGDAEKFFTQALQRNPKSWRALYGLAGLHRRESRVGQALRYYEYAATYVPKKGADRAKVFREWGMTLRDSGNPDAARDAAAKFEIALKVSPNDYMARHALGNMYVKIYAYDKAIDVFQPLLKAGVPKTLAMTVPLLQKCYERTNRTLELAELKSQYSQYLQE